jgi:hypothetical protein
MAEPIIPAPIMVKTLIFSPVNFCFKNELHIFLRLAANTGIA